MNWASHLCMQFIFLEFNVLIFYANIVPFRGSTCYCWANIWLKYDWSWNDCFWSILKFYEQNLNLNFYWGIQFVLTFLEKNFSIMSSNEKKKYSYQILNVEWNLMQQNNKSLSCFRSLFLSPLHLFNSNCTENNLSRSVAKRKKKLNTCMFTKIIYAIQAQTIYKCCLLSEEKKKKILKSF